MSITRDLISNGEHVPALSARTTEDPGAGMAEAKRLRTGIVHVDDQSVSDEPQAPFGGIQESGYGKFGGQAGVESFSERRWITVQEEGHARFPF